jgi:ribosome-associated translation inhibitor RaiA
MAISDKTHELHITLSTKHCELSSAEIVHMEKDLDTLGALVEDFPVSDLHVTVIRHPATNDYHVKTTLALPGRKLFTGERHVEVHPAYKRCLHKLIEKVHAYKQEMTIHADAAKQMAGTHQEIEPSGMFNTDALNRAVEANDYPAFRRAIDVFEPALMERVGKWMGRYPEISSQAEWPISVSEVVEEVFLNAFDQFPTRSHDVPPGQWLEHLIDPSVQALVQSPDEEFERVRFSSSVFEES